MPSRMEQKSTLMSADDQKLWKRNLHVYSCMVCGVSSVDFDVDHRMLLLPARFCARLSSRLVGLTFEQITESAGYSSVQKIPPCTEAFITSLFISKTFLHLPGPAVHFQRLYQKAYRCISVKKYTAVRCESAAGGRPRSDRQRDRWRSNLSINVIRCFWQCTRHPYRPT